ncbi:hypothetical protein KIN20_031331 [Parelaphostrongylus tenuis]|uniref:Uncharacterized protein n=1 Tax=Parelaphostrongylus tenuis TaxID=148309 RepID=A0AAD5WGY1_PARTN|nr:hypothetical protein KIN20_031331 [Parelaphostrongylus tenuis]
MMDERERIIKKRLDPHSVVHSRERAVKNAGEFGPSHNITSSNPESIRKISCQVDRNQESSMSKRLEKLAIRGENKRKQPTNMNKSLD